LTALVFMLSGAAVQWLCRHWYVVVQYVLRLDIDIQSIRASISKSLVQVAPLLSSAINANYDDLVPNEGSMLIFW